MKNQETVPTVIHFGQWGVNFKVNGSEMQFATNNDFENKYGKDAGEFFSMSESSKHSINFS